MNDLANIESMSSVMMLPAPSVQLSLDGIRAHDFYCPSCGSRNMISTILIDNICKCRICSHRFDISNLSTVVARRADNSNFDLIFFPPPIDDTEVSGAQRVTRFVMGAAVGLVVVVLVANFITRKIR
jgi:hypothetical protein